MPPQDRIRAYFKIIKDSFMEKQVTIRIAGHGDHGKTSLVRALTGIDTDRLEEERRRGLSIESGIVPFDLKSGSQVALIDVPGHTDFLKNAIRGLSSVDMAILVVAADDILFDPQTSGGLLICIGQSEADLLLEDLKEKGITEAAVIGEVISEPVEKILVR